LGNNNAELDKLMENKVIKCAENGTGSVFGKLNRKKRNSFKK